MKSVVKSPVKIADLLRLLKRGAPENLRPAGAMKDKRTKRKRTRSAQKRDAISREDA
jgi:hypothetical protein